jgi:energy-coupling factor transport system ATP-binding protein
METVIAFSDICFTYPNSPGAVGLNRVSFQIREGEYVLLCGPSGSGKSTVAFMMNGLVPQFSGGEVQGTLLVKGLDPRKVPVADFLETVGLVFQNADAQLFNSTVESEIAFGLESLGLSAGEIDRRIGHTADRFQIGHLLNRSPVSLSGGEKRIVAIASVCCLDPPVLILDEPFAHLDWDGAGRLADALRRIHGEGKTVIVIEQRVENLLGEVNRCLVLDQGMLVFDGPPDGAGALLRSRHLIPKYPERKADPSVAVTDSPVLRVSNVVSRLGDRPVLKGVSFDAHPGQILSLVGKNGAGKTTIAKHLNGLLKPDEGEIYLMGSDLRGKDPSELASLIAVAFQNANDQFFKTSVLKELTAGPDVLGKRDEKWIQEICRLFDLGGLLDRSPYRLSEGQKKRLSIASVLAMRPEILVLDEPTVGQDGRFLETLAGILTTLRQKGVTVVLVTHDLDFAAAVSDQWVVIQDGRAVFQGAPEQVMARDSTGLGKALMPKRGIAFETLRN